MAASNGDIYVVEMLLERDANTEAADIVSRNVIMAGTALRIILYTVLI